MKGIKVERTNIRNIKEWKGRISNRDYDLISSIIEESKKHNVMDLAFQGFLEDKGLGLWFRGFNSHSMDLFIFKSPEDGKYYFSIGMANINKAGRGYQFPLDFVKGKI